MNENNHLPATKIRCALRDMPPGSHGIVRDLHGDAYFITILASRGLTVGAELSVLRNSGHGSLLIMVRDTGLAPRRSEAAWIEVEPSATGDEHEPDR